MKNSISRIWLIAALLLAVAMPSTALAQGRGHGRGRTGDWSNRTEHNRGWSKRAEHDRDWSNRGWRTRRAHLPNYNKKCGKFVNCHDARNGRLDNRGPRGDRVGYANSRSRRYRNNNGYWRNRRHGLRRVVVNP